MRLPRIPPLLALLLGTSLSACDGGGTAYAASDARVRPAHGVSLAAEHAFADRFEEVERIHPASYRDRVLLGRGWCHPPEITDDDLAPETRVWTDALAAEVILHLREPAPRTVVLHAVPAEPAPGDEIAVELNGERVGAWPAEREGVRIEAELPVELQRPGRNVLVLRAAALHRAGDHSENTRDPRTLGLSVGPIEVRIADAGVRERAQAARELVPGGSRVRALGGERRALEQVSGSALETYLDLVPESRLCASLVLAEGSDASEAARFLVRRTGPDGEEAVVLDQVVVLDEAVEVDVPIGPERAGPHRLALAVEPLEGLAPVVGAWVDPWVTPRAEPAPDAGAEPAALARARERLARAPVVLVLLDALNPSFTSPYGGGRGVTPTLQRLADQGATFERAYAQATYTIASVASLLTSTYGWQHGTWTEGSALPAALTTWPEAFRAAGYRTAAIVHSPNGSSIFGFERGFEQHLELFRNRAGKRPIALAEEVLPALDEVLAASDDRPLCLWLHILEPHEPYEPPDPFRGALGSDEVGGLPPTFETMRRLAEREVVPTDADLEGLRRAYQENLAYVDDVLGRVFERLERAGLYDDAVIAVFSDHGESLTAGHHGKLLAAFGHGSTANEPMAHIPMLVKLPDGLAPAGARPDGLVAAIDLFPTVADLVGVAPLEGPGASFARALFEPGARTRAFVASHSASARPDRFLPIAVALWSDSGAKYVHESGGARALFDLALDPGERDDLAAEREIQAGRLRRELRRLSGLDLDRGAVLVSHGGGEIDAELRAQLDALGY